MNPHDILSICCMPHSPVVICRCKYYIIVCISQTSYGGCQIMNYPSPSKCLLRHKRLSRRQILSFSVNISWQAPHTQNGGKFTGGTVLSEFSFTFSIMSLSTNGLDINPSFATFTRVSWSKLSIISQKTYQTKH